jgi:beta-mannosidase
MLTCGPWRPINLEIYESRIADLYFRTDVEESLKAAKVIANADV